jgi:hypothetical protein
MISDHEELSDSTPTTCREVEYGRPPFEKATPTEIRRLDPLFFAVKELCSGHRPLELVYPRRFRLAEVHKSEFDMCILGATNSYFVGFGGHEVLRKRQVSLVRNLPSAFSAPQQKTPSS